MVHFRWLTLFLLVCLTVTGCGGCQPIDPVEAAKRKKEEDEKKKSEKPKDPFESGDLLADPSEGKASSNFYKPGHWFTATQTFKSNDTDLPGGEFYSTVVDNANKPLELDHAPFRLISSRPAALSQGQTKHFEFLYYPPRRFEGQNTARLFQNRLYARGGARELYAPGNQSMNRLAPFQYHLAVLATDANRYGYLNQLESIRPKSASVEDQSGGTFHYRVSLPKIEKSVPLPTHPLAWTSLAYILWDGIDPALLTPDQQTGLVDWLHFGGHLIISGPESLDVLRASFLADYLPAEKVKSLNLEQAAFDELNRKFALRDMKKELRTLNVTDGKPPVGVELKLAAGAQFVPHSGVLAAEKRVGRGRVVVTAFSLTSRTIVNWGSLDNYFNNALLRRARRKFEKPPENTPGAENLAEAEIFWVDHRRRDDPLLYTNVRYFSRDIGGSFADTRTAGARAFRTVPRSDSFAPPERVGISPPPAADSVLPADASANPGAITPERAPSVYDTRLNPTLEGYASDGQSGVGGWNDFNACAAAAFGSLREAAGISIPKAEFVMRVLAVYLAVLVPLNWGFFRLIGRVEWAWVAAPVIAIVGAVAVVKMAQLDIGFVRSQTEICVLEAHAGHSRGHVARYAALYSSLSTNYEFRFADGHAVAQPFPIAKRELTLGHLQEAPSTVYLRRDKDLTLSGFLVRSSSTSYIHAEQMLPLGGAVTLTGSADAGYGVSNQTDYTLRDATVFRAVEPGNVKYAYLGELGSKLGQPLRFASLPDKSKVPAEWAASEAFAAQAKGSGTVSLAALAQLAAAQLQLAPGDMRLVAWVDVPLPGMDVTPQASQGQTRTLVIVHLHAIGLGDVHSDLNLRISIVDEAKDKEQDSAEMNPSDMPPE